LRQFKLNDVFVNGEKGKIISISKLQKVKAAIDRFKQDHNLNGFQKWICNDLYRFDMPGVDFSIQSIILIAIPHPFYAEVVFTKNKKDYHFISLVMSDFDKTEKVLNRIVSAGNYNFISVQNLPLKRLAVQSGLAVYGRNNICYIDGMGSNFSLAAYYSDIPCSDEYWTEVTMASVCTNCNACLSNCPTGAIQKNKFLIDTKRCLSYWNEGAEPFPAWIPKSAHHCVYDCIKCQIICPMNTSQIKNVVGPVQFTESETNILLSGLHHEKLSDSFKQKIHYLGLHQWPEGISKNMKTLFELNDNKR
jgi:epoxyqueuosine reductase